MIIIAACMKVADGVLLQFWFCRHMIVVSPYLKT